MKRLARAVTFTAILASLLNAASLAQGPDTDKAEPRVLHLQGNLYLVAGAGGNIAVQIGDDGVLIVDTGYAEMAGKTLAAIRRLTDKPIRHVINTHIHPDHSGGNEIIVNAGQAISGLARREIDQALLYAHENVLLGMSASGDEFPTPLWPTETYFVEPMELYFNGEAIQLLHVPNAHTDGDSLVYFRGSDVIVAGDVFLTTHYPYIDEARGGNINGIIDALNRIIWYTVPAANEEGGTLVISGHGRVGDEYDVVVYRDMLTIIRDRIEDMFRKGMSLQAVQDARPTMDFDGRYGTDEGAWTTGMFIEAVYREVQE